MLNFNIKKKRESLIICMILILAAFLRLFRLGYQSLWIDEINAVILAGKNIYKIIFTGDPTPPFIYSVNHFWQKLGNSDFMVRMPSVILGVLSIYAIYKLARTFFGVKEALFSSFLISISLYHIIYSQEAARPYTALILFSLLSFYCLYQMFQAYQKKYAISFVIFSVLNFYTHYFAIFVLAIEAIIAVIFILQNIFKKKETRSIIKQSFRFFSVMFWIFVFCLPYLYFFILATKSGLAEERAVFNPIYYKNLLCRYGAGNGLALFVYNLFFASGILSLARKDKIREILFLLIWLFLPFLMLSFLNLSHFFHIRYVIFTYPAYIVIVSKGITNILDMKLLKPLKKMALALIIIIFLGLSFIPLRLYYQMPARLGDWKGAIEYVYSKADDGAFIITNLFHNTLLQYYLNKKPIPGKIHIATHYNDERFFNDMLLHSAGRQLYYITSGNDEIESVAEAYFENKKLFFPPVYERLGKRELIDWDDTSWFSISEKRYRLVVYSNNKD